MGVGPSAVPRVPQSHVNPLSYMSSHEATFQKKAVRSFRRPRRRAARARMDTAVVESVRQVVTAKSMAVEIELAGVESAASLDLLLSDAQLSLTAGDVTRLISFVLPIASGGATSKFSRRKQTLQVRAPLAAACTPPSLCFRVTVGGLGRGMVDEDRLPA